MKKRNLIFLAAVLMISLLAGCGNTSSSKGQENDPSSQSSLEIVSSSEEQSSSQPESSSSTPEDSSSSQQGSSSVPEDSSSSADSSSQPQTGGAMQVDTDYANLVLKDLNGVRNTQNLSALTLDEKLSSAAVEYAQQLYAGGKEFRKTGNFTTLPDGREVTDLVQESGFDSYVRRYHVWVNQNDDGAAALESLIKTTTSSDLYKEALKGEYRRVGIACATSDSADDPFVCVIVFYA